MCCISRFYDAQGSRDAEPRGTAFSAPPERFGFRQTDPRSDIYALGVLLHELSTGENLLEKGTTPAPLRTVVDRCTRFDPKDRYQSAAAPELALKRATAAIVLSVALSLCTGAAFLRGREAEEGIYNFHSPAIEAEVCRQLQKEPGTVTRDDLKEISSPLLCGEISIDSWDQIDVRGTDITSAASRSAQRAR